MKKIISLNLNTKWGILLILFFACIFTIISYFKEHKKIKEQENKLSTKDKIKLYLNRFIHYNSSILIMFFPYIFEYDIKKYILFIIYFIIISISWLIYKECPISIHEKQILDNTYKCGDNSLYEPYTVLIYNIKNDTEAYIIQSRIKNLFRFNACVIFYRLFCLK